jgi:hypothetical protein
MGPPCINHGRDIYCEQLYKFMNGVWKKVFGKGHGEQDQAQGIKGDVGGAIHVEWGFEYQIF